MVTLLVATSIDLASINPANALLAMPGWQPLPSLQDMKSFSNQGVRMLVHGNSIIREDHLEKWWEDATGEVVNEVIFFCKHTAVSNRPALTVHPIGVPQLREEDVAGDLGVMGYGDLWAYMVIWQAWMGCATQSSNWTMAQALEKDCRVS